MLLTLYNDRPASAPAAARFEQESVLKKVKALDAQARRHGLGSLNARRNPLIALGMECDQEGRVTKNSYGVLHLSWLAAQYPEWADAIAFELDMIRRGVQEAHQARLRFLIWAGMGGSAEDKSMYQALGLLKKGPRLYVLDSTDPAKLKAILGDLTARSGGSLARGLRSTLVVGMAMGMTSYEPVVNLEKLAQLYDRQRIDSRPNFFYMTLADSLLDRFAGARGYRRVELQLDRGNATAGRHSAPLTRGSLYPLGLAGVDLGAWLAGAVLSAEDIEGAFRLAAFLHIQGLEGRDKVTLALPRALEGVALWTKQNYEESLGKREDLGIKIVIGEPLRLADYRAPKDARQDRVFLAVQQKRGARLDAAKLGRIRRDYPTALLTLPENASMAQYLQFTHYVVFGLGWLRQMNFVTQPAVELYKALTARLAEEAGRAGGIEKTAAWQAFRGTPRQAWRGPVCLRWERLGEGGDKVESADAAEQYAALLAGRRKEFEYGELTFFGDTRYDARGRAVRRVLEGAAGRVFREALRMPCDVYEGPAMNHSYHEMVMGHGRCFSTVLLCEKAEKIAEIGYTADYHRAQFLATQEALARRGRLVVSITLRDLEEGSREALADFFGAAGRALKKAVR